MRGDKMALDIKKVEYFCITADGNAGRYDGKYNLTK